MPINLLHLFEQEIGKKDLHEANDIINDLFLLIECS